MALSKSTIKTVDKTQLYFNKYSYKASVTALGVYWVRSAKSLADFTSYITRRYEEWQAHKDRYPNGWYRQPPPVTDHDLLLIENIINIKNSLEGTDVRFRHEYDTFTFYTNDAVLIKKLADDIRWSVEQVNINPTGIKYFKKDPPAKFRTYMTNNKVDPSFLNEMPEYLNRTEDVTPSSAFTEWLQRSRMYSYNYCWLHSTHFVDYNDEKNLMMMHLLFPGAMGKTFKLEKKPS